MVIVHVYTTRACVRACCVCVCVLCVCARARALNPYPICRRSSVNWKRGSNVREQRERVKKESGSSANKKRGSDVVGQRRREERERRETEQRASVPVCMCYASLVHVHRKMWTQSVKYGNTHTYTRVCLCVLVCMYVRICTYIVRPN
jgi:hypothetical protein